MMVLSFGGCWEADDGLYFAACSWAFLGVLGGPPSQSLLLYIFL